MSLFKTLMTIIIIINNYILNQLCSCFYLYQVNFMSAQMVTAASKDINVSGESLDEMKLLEEEARKMSEETEKDKPKTMKFVK